jgi:phenylalanyl-tRNA synthetase beta chain
MNFSYNWLQSFFSQKLPAPEKLAELLNLHSFEVEEVRKTKNNDFVLDIKILANRAPDCSGHLGIAKEIAAILNQRVIFPLQHFKENQKVRTQKYLQVKVKEEKGCFRYTTRLIFDVEVGESPLWLKERLATCGLQSINNIVDVANYVMLETGQPLHVFDFDKIAGVSQKEIIVRRAKEGEKILGLDNKEYILDSETLVIADKEKLLAIAGIKGGQGSEITSETKKIIIESANFNPIFIRRASKKLGLKTDASWRFERGLDPTLTKIALQRAAFLILKLAGGLATKGEIDFWKVKTKEKKIRLPLILPQKILGQDFKESEIKNFLKRLGFEFKKQNKEELLVKVPSLRRDIEREVDLIEEIGRLAGFQKIKGTLPLASLKPALSNLSFKNENKVRDLLTFLNFQETYNYSFISAKAANFLSKEYPFHSLVAVENPQSEEQKYLRPTLLMGLFSALKQNARFFEKVNLFEIGKVYLREKNNFSEKTLLAIGILAKKDKKIFFELKGVLESLIKKFGVVNVSFTEKEKESSFWQLKKSAVILSGKDYLGEIGVLSSKVKEFLGLDFDFEIAALEVDFEKLIALSKPEKIYQEIVPYPASVKDISVLVPFRTQAAEVLKVIRENAAPIIQSVELFDIYEGKNLPQNTKSFTFHIIYQAKDRTLSSSEIEKEHQKIIEAIKKNPAWQVR